MSLDLDILIYLMRLTRERRDVSAMMRTCHALYSAGMSSLLSFNIRIKDDHRFAAFCSFMNIDAPGRSRFLRQMTLYMPDLSQSCRTTLDHIICILQHANQLHRLTIITFDGREFGCLDPRLIGALSSLTSIKDLTLAEVTDDMVTMLQSLQSPVAKAHIHFEPAWLDEIDMDPILVLRNLSFSLRQLEVRWPVFPLAPHYDIQYSLLTELKISENIRSPVLLAPLIYSFPNLRNLHIIDVIDEGEDSEDDIEEHRQANIFSQSQRHWEALDYVSSDILYLYQLGLSCKVHHLRLELPEDHNLNLIKKVLYMVRPTRLDIVCSSDEINYSPMRLDRTVDYLTHLHVKVKNRNSYANTSRIVHNILAFLPPLTCMTHFTFHLEWQDEVDPWAVCKELLQIDRGSLATRVTEAAPAVRYIVLKLSTEFAAGSSVWQVLRSGGISSLKELTSQDAQRVKSELALGPDF